MNPLSQQPEEGEEIIAPKYRNISNDDVYPIRKRSNCYILLPKNYFNYIEKNIATLSASLRKKIRDIGDIQHDYTLPFYQDYIFKLSTYKTHSKATAVMMISEYLFHELEKTYKKMSYIKITLLIPDNVIGFVIGIEGRNINAIRSESSAKIEVFQPVSKARFRQIEIKGDPYCISKASERIFSIEEKYINFGKRIRGHTRSRSNSQRRQKAQAESDKEEGIVEDEEEQVIKRSSSKSDIDVLFKEEEIEEIKNRNKDIWNDIEKIYQCTIKEKKVNINNKEMVMVKFNGTPEDNSKGIFVLLHHMIPKGKNEEKK